MKERTLLHFFSIEKAHGPAELRASFRLSLYYTAKNAFPGVAGRVRLLIVAGFMNDQSGAVRISERILLAFFKRYSWIE